MAEITTCMLYRGSAASTPATAGLLMMLSSLHIAKSADIASTRTSTPTATPTTSSSPPTAWAPTPTSTPLACITWIPFDNKECNQACNLPLFFVAGRVEHLDTCRCVLEAHLVNRRSSSYGLRATSKLLRS